MPAKKDRNLKRGLTRETVKIICGKILPELLPLNHLGYLVSEGEPASPLQAPTPEEPKDTGKEAWGPIHKCWTFV